MSEKVLRKEPSGEMSSIAPALGWDAAMKRTIARLSYTSLGSSASCLIRALRASSHGAAERDRREIVCFHTRVEAEARAVSSW
jgi:hypothetical protein